MARSFFASEVIQANEEWKGPAKWIALVDQEHMTSFRGYRGISEQTDALSVRIDDVTAWFGTTHRRRSRISGGVRRLSGLSCP